MRANTMKVGRDSIGVADRYRTFNFRFNWLLVGLGSWSTKPTTDLYGRANDTALSRGYVGSAGSYLALIAQQQGTAFSGTALQDRFTVRV